MMANADVYPKKVIFRTFDILSDFYERVDGLGLSNWDKEEMIRQVLDGLLDGVALFQRTQIHLPAFDRLTRNILLTIPESQTTVRQAYHKLSSELFQRLNEIGSFNGLTPQTDFPYTFNRLVALDVVMDRFDF